MVSREALELAHERLMEFLAASPFWTVLIWFEVGQTFVSNRVDEWRLGTLEGCAAALRDCAVAPGCTTAGPGVEGAYGSADRQSLRAIGIGLIPVANVRVGSTRGTGVSTDGWVTYRCRADDTEVIRRSTLIRVRSLTPSSRTPWLRPRYR